MNLVLLASLGLVLMFVMFTLIWLWQRKFGDASVVDVFWSWSIGLLALVYAWLGDGALIPRIALALLCSLWAMRLATYLGTRYAAKSKEDERYTQLREEWGKSQDWKMLRFFWFQGIAAWGVAMAFLPIISSEYAPHSFFIVVGVAIWIFAVWNEAMSDAHLQAFRSDPNNKGEICKKGWWRYSRHPNYFFEWLHWCSYPFLALGAGWWGLASLIAPIVMYFVLTRLTGVTLNDEQTASSRPGHAEYVKNTNAFFPWFPKGSKN